jgi:hypothetical protein
MFQTGLVRAVHEMPISKFAEVFSFGAPQSQYSKENPHKTAQATRLIETLIPIAPMKQPLQHR